MCSRVIGFLHQTNFFAESQHGYLKNRSTQTAMFQLTKSIIDLIENNNMVLAMFLDLSKA